MSHDPKCYELAEYFLPSTATLAEIMELGDAIQETIEDHLRARSPERARYEAHIKRIWGKP
jgi:hypothetical protein